MTTITFSQPGEFAALHAAEAWCEQAGYSVGQQQRGAPCGLRKGKFLIAKWRNLTVQERMACDGQMTGDMRNGPVVIKLKAQAQLQTSVITIQPIPTQLLQRAASIGAEFDPESIEQGEPA